MTRGTGAAVTVVGIGASAGGLDASRKLVADLPVGAGMAFILVQHLDPTHDSMMAELLAPHTSLKVLQATDGMPVEADCFYVIPPGVYLSTTDGALRLSNPAPHHGARLPFDFLLQSMAKDCGARAVCVVLSGTGADGSLGLRAIKEKGGLVIAQDPEDAPFDGMPRSAIMTGDVDLILPVKKISAALAGHSRLPAEQHPPNAESKARENFEFPVEIVEMLRTRTAHDFTLYKKGTLQRRIERRMALMSLGAGDIDRYLHILRNDAKELERLAAEMLINVTSFFRDQRVFDFVSENIAPQLIEGKSSEDAIRLWVAGCSTGEEAYSFAMIFLEKLDASGSKAKVQIFASDVDPDAVEQAREGFFPESISADVTAERIKRFFNKEADGFRVSPELRASVIFTVQDVLSDPPFSRLDMISCRNMLIYLGAEAQARVISLFDFALKDGGILVLGTSETPNLPDGRFDVISKTERAFRKVGRGKPAVFGYSAHEIDGERALLPAGAHPAGAHLDSFATLCEDAIRQRFTPAAVLINAEFECRYFVGPVKRHLRFASGQPTNNLLAMVQPDLRPKLRAIVKKAIDEQTAISALPSKMTEGEYTGSMRLEALPTTFGEAKLILVCFIEETAPAPAIGEKTAKSRNAREAELEAELDAMRTELLGAIRSLELSAEEQKAIHEEALSVNEEFQSTNEELLTSKEELQSLNEELTALNTQLHEALERQRVTSDDLENILNSTDVATLLLDEKLHIRFFTPATRLMFNVIQGDIGRPLGDLRPLASDPDLLSDAQTVLEKHESIAREIHTPNGKFFVRRMLPYRTRDNSVEFVAGVVITYSDITERKKIADLLGAAKREADLASLAKSRFLAAASHDLRQPLQTLSLLLGLIGNEVTKPSTLELLARFEKSLAGMSNMLNTLLDLNHIEAGVVQPEIQEIDVNALLLRMKEEFDVQAQVRDLSLRIAPCRYQIVSDPHLIEQMLRNLISNALKYTETGGILLGCRRRNGKLSLEVCDTGVGIPLADIDAIFDEHVQLGNPVSGQGGGLGLGLAIVRRVGKLLNHRIGVKSVLGRGSVFSIEFETAQAPEIAAPAAPPNIQTPASETARSGAILLIEDDPEVSDLLSLTLTKEGYHVLAAPHGEAALSRIKTAAIVPDLIVADFNLGKGDSGLQAAVKLQQSLKAEIPVIVLTGDITPATLREISLEKCVHLSKPVNPSKLTRVIARMLPPVAPEVVPASVDEPPGVSTERIVYIVDDETEMLETMSQVLVSSGHHVQSFSSCEEFLAGYDKGRKACLLVDAYLPGMNGLDLINTLRESGDPLPVIMITGRSDIGIAVNVMKAGASDFLEKPVSRKTILKSIKTAFASSKDESAVLKRKSAAKRLMAGLTPRQLEIMTRVLAGEPSKNIAADLGISQRTVENHRAAIMKKTGSKSLPELARLAVAAE
ncbi:MAG: chemotaxis protein CheB [Parvularculaceae bacterium]|nr:chemotaxis protein CheB [Parvularculaceae bacterium]